MSVNSEQIMADDEDYLQMQDAEIENSSAIDGEDLDDEDLDEDKEDDISRDTALKTEILKIHVSDDSIYTIGLTPDARFCIAGDGSDKASVINLVSGEIIQKIDEFGDSVHLIELLTVNNRTVVAIADMSGKIIIGRITESGLVDIKHRINAEADVNWMKWSRVESVFRLCVGTAEGMTIVYLVSSARPGFDVPIQDVFVPPQGATTTNTGIVIDEDTAVFVGYDNGARQIYSLQGGETRKLEFIPKKHEADVTCSHYQPSFGLIASGDSNGNITIHRSVNMQMVFSIASDVMQIGGNRRADCTDIDGVAFSPSGAYLAAIAIDGVLSIVATSGLKYMGSTRVSTGAALTGLEWVNDHEVTISCHNGCLYLVSVREMETKCSIFANELACLGFALLPSKDRAITYGDDQKCRIVVFPTSDSTN